MPSFIDRAKALIKDGRPEDGVALLREAISSGSAEAAIELATFIGRHDHLSIEARDLVERAEELVKSDDYWCHYLIYLAMCYRDIGKSDFLERHRRGIQHLVVAATPDDGMPVAMLELGLAYAKGGPVLDRDTDKAKEWLECAARAGDEEVTRNAKTAIRSLKKLDK